MLFNSYLFILCFMPVACALYWSVLKWCPRWLFPATSVISLGFIFAGGVRSSAILAVSVIVNYFLLRLMRPGRRGVLWAGVFFNLLYLGYFKYALFVTSNLAEILPRISVLTVILPIGISFYTFQKITVLLDTYRGQVRIGGFWDYVLFVTFFPQLIAGPIVHYAELMPQFRRPPEHLLADIRTNLWKGATLFMLGLAKKVILADFFASYADPIFADPAALTAGHAWLGALSYSFQIYFDFGGYVDMAIGTALCFGIVLPPNFNSPYKSRSFVEFWRRWHITLSKFLRDHLYIPLGGGRAGPWRQGRNLLLTMAIGGLWHGAAWGFILWGVAHGLLLCFNHAVNHFFPRLKIPAVVSIVGVFLVVTLLWVPFRAVHLKESLAFWGKMGELKALAREVALWWDGLSAEVALKPGNWFYDESGLLWMLTAVSTLALVWFAPNSSEIAGAIEARIGQDGPARFRLACAGFLLGLLFALSLFVMNMHTAAKFIYFQF